MHPDEGNTLAYDQLPPSTPAFAGKRYLSVLYAALIWLLGLVRSYPYLDRFCSAVCKIGLVFVLTAVF